jgi:trk system potassium uptake protein TrkA
MKIVILGAGRVGESVAESLVSEKNDITIIDTDPAHLKTLQDRIDLRGVAGNGINPSVLQQAGIEDADIFIAAAQMDETNLVAAKLASKLFNVPDVIARVRSTEFPGYQELLGKDGFGVTHLICPEQSVTNYIENLIEYPEALQILEFANGEVSLIGVRAYAGGPLVTHNLEEIPALVPGVGMRIVAIFRNERAVGCEGYTRIEPGDEVFVMCETRHIRKVLGALRRMDKPVKRVMIAGGGNIGLRLARAIEKDYQIKIIERNKKRCEYVATQTASSTLVFNGDATDEDLLHDENVSEMDLFLALTNDDENNIMSALLAKRLGARRTIALINRKAYGDLMQGSQIDVAISPAQAVIGELLQHVRRGDVVSVHSLRRGAAEALEAIAHGDARTSKVVGCPSTKLPLPKGAQLGAIVRYVGVQETATEILFPSADVIIQPEDHLIFFLPSKRMIRDLEKLFQVGATFF